jgi:elongator complex protein 4
MRKRLIFETLHLDVEGGVGDRRTTPSANVLAMDAGTPHPRVSETLPGVLETHPRVLETLQGEQGADIATVEVQFESAAPAVPSAGGEDKAKVKKPKKKVAFQSNRPELYDF